MARHYLAWLTMMCQCLSLRSKIYLTKQPNRCKYGGQRATNAGYGPLHIYTTTFVQWPNWQPLDYYEVYLAMQSAENFFKWKYHKNALKLCFKSFQMVSILLKNSNKCDKNEVSAPGTCKKQCLQSQCALKRQLMSLLIK